MRAASKGLATWTHCPVYKKAIRKVKEYSHKGDSGFQASGHNGGLPYSCSTRLILKKDLLSGLLADCQIYWYCCQLYFGLQGGRKLKMPDKDLCCTEKAGWLEMSATSCCTKTSKSHPASVVSPSDMFQEAQRLRAESSGAFTTQRKENSVIYPFLMGRETA